MKGSLQKRGKYWYLRVDIGKDPVTGKRIQKNINTKCTKKTDAQKVQAEILNKLNNGMLTNPTNITFVDFMEMWLKDYCEKNLEKTTCQAYRLVFESHIKPYFKDLKLTELQPIHLQKYYNYLLTSGRKGKNKKSAGLSSNTVYKHHANIRKCLDYALKMQLVARNVALSVEPPKKKKYQGKAYNEKQLQKLIKVTEGEPIQVAIMLAVGLGLRRGEVCGLKWEHIDFENGVVNIIATRTRTTGKEIEKGTKNKSSTRTLPLPKFLADYLKKVKRQQKEQKLLCGKGYSDSGYVCVWADGTPLKVDYISRRFSEIINKYGLEKIRFHDLRHTNATLLLSKGVNIKWISEWLGHSNITTTMDIYSHVTKQMKKEVAKELDNIFNM